MYAPQTIFEFEMALQAGGTPQMPEDVDDVWVPSLEPIFKDFIERVRRQDRATGGTGGIKGGWQAWVPWWVSEQRAMQVPDFTSNAWLEAIRVMRDKDDKNAIYKIDWERKVGHTFFFFHQRNPAFAESRNAFTGHHFESFGRLPNLPVRGHKDIHQRLLRLRELVQTATEDQGREGSQSARKS